MRYFGHILQKTFKVQNYVRRHAKIAKFPIISNILDINFSKMLDIFSQNRLRRQNMKDRAPKLKK